MISLFLYNPNFSRDFNQNKLGKRQIIEHIFFEVYINIKRFFLFLNFF